MDSEIAGIIKGVLQLLFGSGLLALVGVGVRKATAMEVELRQAVLNMNQHTREIASVREELEEQGKAIARIEVKVNGGKSE